MYFKVRGLIINVVTNQELIAELCRRSGMLRKDYAAVLRISEQHLSQIINGAEPGSWKIVERAFEHAKIRCEECILDLPPEDGGDAAALEEIDRRIRLALKLGKQKALLEILRGLAPDPERTGKARKPKPG